MHNIQFDEISAFVHALAPPPIIFNSLNYNPQCWDCQAITDKIFFRKSIHFPYILLLNVTNYKQQRNKGGNHS